MLCQSNRKCLSKIKVLGQRYLSCSKPMKAVCSKFDIDSQNFRNYLRSVQNEYIKLQSNPSTCTKSHNRLMKLENISKLLSEYEKTYSNIVMDEDIEKEESQEFKQLLIEENKELKLKIEHAKANLLKELVDLEDDETCATTYFGITAGVGGQEAMLFSMELFKMYMNYFLYKEWDTEVLEKDISDLGGLRHANIMIQNTESYNNLRFEAGVHRVQRVPSTEKSGRLHTSTVSITVLPEIPDINIKLDEKSLKIETKRASGAGGQHVNTTDSAVRIVHIETGTVVECQSERSQTKNKEIAMKKLRLKLMQHEMHKAQNFRQKALKSQQGNLNRNEKIRTYNFLQDRITDHRVPNGTIYNVESLLEGTIQLDNYIQRIALEKKKLELLARLNNYSK